MSQPEGTTSNASSGPERTGPVGKRPGLTPTQRLLIVGGLVGGSAGILTFAIHPDLIGTPTGSAVQLLLPLSGFAMLTGRYLRERKLRNAGYEMTRRDLWR